MPPKSGKQATKGGKQIVEENKATLKFYKYMILTVNGIFLASQILFFWGSFTLAPIISYSISVLMHIGSFYFMSNMAKSRYSDTGALLDSGLDLNMESGMAEHAKDTIILSSATQILALITNYFWLLLLLAPGRALYMLWVNILAPWIFAEAPEVDEKKTKKMERKMKRGH